MGFTAGGAVEPLAYDLEPYVTGCKGIIAEPTSAQVDAYQEALTAIRRDGDAAEETPDEHGRPAGERAAEAIAAVCSHAPSAEEVSALPWRVRLAFSGWLWRELVNPTRPAAGTKPSLAVVRDDGSSV